MADLTTKTARKRLKPRGSAYTQVLAEGRAIAYRKRRAGYPGRWMLRTAKFKGGYGFEVLGIADDVVDADGMEILSYTQALALALSRRAADPNKITVKGALDAWAKDKCIAASSEKQCLDIRSSAARIAASFPRKTLKTITARDIQDWMAEIVAEGDDPRPRKSTANRRLAIFKAALTKSADENKYGGAREWTTVKKFRKAESFGARMVILTEAQEQRFIESARSDVADLLIALKMTGARFGEIRLARCHDLMGNRLTLEGKTGRRTISLSDEKARWFSARTDGKDSDDPLITRRDGVEWPDGGQLKPVRTAAKVAGLAKDVTTYALRHGFISRALSRGVPISAVAQHCGTSAEMIEASYAKFTSDQMSAWFD